MQRDFLDDDCVTLLSVNHEKPKEEMQQLLLQWNYDYLTATYLILLSRKAKGKPLQLGSHTLESLKKSQLEVMWHNIYYYILLYLYTIYIIIIIYLYYYLRQSMEQLDDKVFW